MIAVNLYTIAATYIFRKIPDDEWDRMLEANPWLDDLDDRALDLIIKVRRYS